ncbi:hypothetical protein, partial [Sinorhizobium medicae]|uniref:hypothetical protein n=1 Tax=Sinorhizobium medicae TaxID=110321 RepID=UPI001AED0F1B
QLVEAIFLAALRLGARRSQSERCLAPIIVHGRLTGITSPDSDIVEVPGGSPAFFVACRGVPPRLF